MEAGELIGDRYRLLAPLGQGGTSVVWQARDEVLGREVAVKLLASRLATDPVLGARLRLEARIAARLHHPHVVAVYDFGEVLQADQPPAPYVVLELVEGGPLSDVLRRGPLPWREGVQICAQLAAALAAAHARGIVHRDVKPSNVMLTRNGAKLVDFGISATIGEADLGPDGQLLGTPAYLAPERLDTGPVRPACDVYGLGLLLYKSLTGELPWPREQLADPIVAHRHTAPAPLPPLRGLPPEVADLCQCCLAKRPADRPASAEVARLLAAAVGTPAVAAALGQTRPVTVLVDPAPTAFDERDSGRLRPSRLAAAVATGAALLLGSLSGSGTGVPGAAPAPPEAGIAQDEPTAGGADPEPADSESGNASRGPEPGSMAGRSSDAGNARSAREKGSHEQGRGQGDQGQGAQGRGNQGNGNGNAGNGNGNGNGENAGGNGNGGDG